MENIPIQMESLTSLHLEGIPMDLQLHSLPADHVDLILTSAISFGIISAPPGTPRPQQVVTAMAQRLGTGLFLRNQRVDPAGYRFRPVEGPLDVRDVVKACHAAQFAYRDTRLWVGSNEQRIVDGVAKAATMRIPGYELSPWVWTRPSVDAIGYAPVGAWWPDELAGVELIGDLDEFIQNWSKARIVLVTLAALDELPALPARPRVYTLTNADQAPTAITASERHQITIDSVLLWPDAVQWLREELLI